jgi:hypothetical protein
VPARSPAPDDPQLAALLAQPGCAVCSRVADGTRRYIQGFLYESVNDVEFRRELDAARGFCGVHIGSITLVDRGQSGGMLGPSILFEAIVRVREAELAAVVGASDWTRRRRSRDAVRPPGCPACRQARAMTTVTLRTLVRCAADPGWSAAMAVAEFCLEHLAGLMAVPGSPAGWAVVERGQLARIAAIRRQVRDFADHSSHHRRHLVTAEERAAVDAAAEFLGAAPRRARR